MKDSKFTPGPWEANIDLYSDGSIGVGPINGKEDAVRALHRANAHLIAAAPEMYEALRLIRLYAGSRDNEGLAGYAEGCRLADLALSKARGEA